MLSKMEKIDLKFIINVLQFNIPYRVYSFIFYDILQRQPHYICTIKCMYRLLVCCGQFEI